MSSADFPVAPGQWPVGRTRRYALHCKRIRSVRVDEKTEARLSSLIRTFSGALPEDSVNPSILFRRALHVYYRQVSAMLTDPHALAAERLHLIENTRKPPRASKDTPPTPADCHR